jgi:hypothetical protein
MWGGGLLLIAAALAWPVSRDWVLTTTSQHPYAMGFAKFAVLASLGEVLSIRIVKGRWRAPVGPLYRAALWGLIGVVMALLFPLFAAGVSAASAAGLLPLAPGEWGAKVTRALWISVIMNVAWAPTLMLAHRLTDSWIDLAGGRFARFTGVRLLDVVSATDWNVLVGVVILRTIPFFWIPAHTITFLLPPNARVLFAALLSLALGAILGFAKRRPAAAVTRSL